MLQAKASTSFIVMFANLNSSSTNGTNVSECVIPLFKLKFAITVVSSSRETLQLGPELSRASIFIFKHLR